MMPSSRSNPSPQAGTIRGLAAAVGVPPQLAVPAGEGALNVLSALKQARDAGGGGVRMNHLARAQAHIAKLDPARHRTLVQHLHANVLALKGRGGDTKIAHVTRSGTSNLNVAPIEC